MKKRITIINELRISSQIFNIHGHDKTSQWIKFIANNLENDSTSDYKQDFFDTLDAYKSDICKDEYSEKVYEEINLILGTSLNVQRESKFHKILLESYPLFKNLSPTSKKINKIGELFLEEYNSGAIEKSFYLSTFTYLLQVEGSYDDIIRILYILILASKNKKIQYEKIFNMKLGDIKRSFRKHGYSDIIFLAWDNGHLRNAIAHARFNFDIKTDKMSFSDFNLRKNKEVYNKSYNLQDFSKKILMIDIVYHIFSDFIILLRIFDNIKHKWKKVK